jgi:hypothetical protein
MPVPNESAPGVRLPMGSAPSPGRWPRPVPLAIAGLAFVVGLGYFFWPAWRSGLTLLPGDVGDPRFLNIVLEHWYRVLRGLAPWRDPPYFFPQGGVLGYGDSLILYVPAYVVLRLAGISVANAYFGALIAVMITGYASMLWLLRRVLGVAPSIAIVGGLIFAFSNMNALAVSHTQLYASAFVPVVIGFSWRAFGAFARGARYFAAAVTVAVLVPLLLYTSFYVGWYTGLLLGTWALVLLLATWFRAPGEILDVVGRLREERWQLLALALIFLVALIPFLATYLPIHREFGNRDWDQVRRSLPLLADIVNVGPDNLAWGWLARMLVPAGRPMGHELTFGLPLLLLAAFTVLLIWQSGWHRATLRDASGPPDRDRAIACLGVAVIVSWLLMVQLGSFSLWRYVHAAVPGAGVIRAPFRYQVVLQLAVIVVVAVGLRRAQATGRGKWAVGVLLAGLVFEQVTAFRATFDAREKEQLVQRVAAPPVSCRYFLLGTAVAPPGRWFESQLDAATVAQRVGVPTVNGYSGQLPRGWDLWVHEIGTSGYASAALIWLQSHNLREGLCLLDLRTGTWQSRDSSLRGTNLIRSEMQQLLEVQAVEFRGFHTLEPPGRWTNGAAVVGLATPISATMLRISGWVWSPGAQVRIAVDGNTAFAQALPAGAFKLDLPQAGSVRTITIDSSTFVPRLLGINDDPRQLGVMIESITIE